MTKAPYSISRADGKSSQILVSALYKDDLLTDLIIEYGDYMINVASGGFTIKNYYAFIGTFQYYLDQIDAKLDGAAMASAMKVFPDKKRINIGDSLYQVDIPTR